MTILAKLVLLILPAAVLTEIHVGLTGNFDPSESNVEVHYYGSAADVISDEEVETFKLSEDNLKYGAKLYFGSRPDDAYLRSPTPWGDLYRTYNWRQVTRLLKPVNAKILKNNSVPQIIVKQDFENNSTTTATYNVAISQLVENTVSSSWSKNGELKVDQDIGYEFEMGFLNSGGYISMSYSSAWGTSTEKKQKVIVGSTSSVEVTLKPGQAVTAELQALKGTIDVEVDYEGSVFGDVAINYANEYKGHHFWKLDVTTVMDSVNLKKKMKSSEVISLGFYGSSKIVIRDKVDPDKIWEITI